MRGRKRWKLEVSLHAERFVCDHIKCWPAVISLPSSHLAYVVVSSVSNLFASHKKNVGGLYVVKKRIVMAPNIKVFALSTCAINDDVYFILKKVRAVFSFRDLELRLLQHSLPVMQHLCLLSNSFAILCLQFFPFRHVDQMFHFELFLNGTSSV